MQPFGLHRDRAESVGHAADVGMTPPFKDLFVPRDEEGKQLLESMTVCMTSLCQSHHK